MPRIEPTSVNAAMKGALKDSVVTKAEANDTIAPAVLRDLVRSENPKETLLLAAKNLQAFLAPFSKNDSQEENGVRLPRDARYTLDQLADTLTQAAESLDQIKGGLFGTVFGIAMQDGMLTVTEARHLEGAAKKMLAGAGDPAAVARTLHSILADVDYALAQAGAFGGPRREEAFPAATDKTMAKIHALLGTAIAKGLESGAAVETLDPDGIFAKNVRTMVDASGYGRMSLSELPRLVDAELSTFDATGLVGPGKLRMEQQADVRAKALVAFVEAMPNGSSKDDVLMGLHRYAFGTYVPPSAAQEFADQLKSADKAELEDVVNQMKKQLTENPSPKGYAARNEQKAIREGIALIEAEIANR
jgi:hypothetical protein